MNWLNRRKHRAHRSFHPYIKGRTGDVIASLTLEHFSRWVKTCRRASVENHPRVYASLFTLDACYYENLFDEPIKGREAIYEYWLRGSPALGDREGAFEILSVRGNLGIAHWKAKFTTNEVGKRITLGCLFVVEFGENGLCQTFRAWWHAS